MGKNAHQFYNKSFKYDTQQRLTIENELRQALINQELCLHYQPKYQVSDKKIAGLEALLRWQHPVRGLLYPNDFIKVAEELGIMVPIGNWVFKTACEHIKQLHNKGLDHLKVSVNLSTIQFHTPDLITFIKNLLEQVDLNSKYLEFELTERMIMFNQEYTFEALNKLKDIGISLSIDDFGTGFSSLSHLSTLPIDTVKIDQSFVDLIDKQGSSPILDSIIDLSHNLDYTVIAEGVETELEYQYLLEKGCDEMQGFLFSKPITFEALTRTLQVDS